MVLDTYFHLIWCYFMVVIWVAQGWNGDIYYSYLLYLALTFMAMATSQKKIITYWNFYTWFVLEFGVLAIKISMEVWCGGNVMEDCNKEL